MKAPPSRKAFDALYDSFNDPNRLSSDPLGRVDRLLPPRDFELVSFVIAGLSYGRVAQIQSSCDSFFGRLQKLGLGPAGEGLADFLRALGAEDEAKLEVAFMGWKHRMNTARDLGELLKRLGAILREHDSLCGLYQTTHHEDATEHLVRFSAALAEAPRPKKSRSQKTPWGGTGLHWFATSPTDGGTCKRLMMWLRWMIREDSIDTGLWTRSPLKKAALPRPTATRLFWPVDTHIFRWARENGVTERASPSWKAVEQITAFFRKVNPDDPVKYDFAVCHLGMERSKKSGQTDAVNGRTPAKRRLKRVIHPE